MPADRTYGRDPEWRLSGQKAGTAVAPWSQPWLGKHLERSRCFHTLETSSSNSYNSGTPEEISYYGVPRLCPERGSAGSPLTASITAEDLALFWDEYLGAGSEDPCEKPWGAPV